MVQKVTAELDAPVRYVSADEPTLQGADWINQQWEAVRLEATGKAGAVLVLDEIQKIPVWSETVKRLWDEDTRKKRRVKVVVGLSATPDHPGPDRESRGSIRDSAASALVVLIGGDGISVQEFLTRPVSEWLAN